MKKKLLVCELHSLAWFRCRRRCWKSRSKKQEGYADEYKEECFKCINEGRYKKDAISLPKNKKHVHIKIM
ncbi:hypothetical protein HYS31_07855 [Candidatus Woesearchaeota archaeon]|nr:hypothetical protein [Candidatus Woesearchaeota archaeon]